MIAVTISAIFIVTIHRAHAESRTRKVVVRADVLTLRYEGKDMRSSRCTWSGCDRQMRVVQVEGFARCPQCGHIHALSQPR